MGKNTLELLSQVALSGWDCTQESGLFWGCFGLLVSSPLPLLLVKVLISPPFSGLQDCGN